MGEPVPLPTLPHVPQQRRYCRRLFLPSPLPAPCCDPGAQETDIVLTTSTLRRRGGCLTCCVGRVLLMARPLTLADFYVLLLLTVSRLNAAGCSAQIGRRGALWPVLSFL